jgi:DNA mismatch repair protein MutS2
MKPVRNELYLRRLPVDQALFQLDQYLNQAFVAGLLFVRIVHGKGTGKLRRAIHASLAGHPLVKSYRLGDYGEGDYGITVVELNNH